MNLAIIHARPVRAGRLLSVPLVLTPFRSRGNERFAVVRFSVFRAGQSLAQHVETPNKLLIAIVTALQKTGTEKFSLKVLAENAKLTVPKTGFVILIRDGEVTLRPSNDTATGTIQQVIEQLQANGYKKFTLRAK